MRTLLAAAATLMACTGTASAGLFFIDLTLNNPSLDPWIAVEFKIIPVADVDYEGGFGEQIKFSELVGDFSTTKPFTTIQIMNDYEVRYQFAAFSLMETGDTEKFTLAMNIEQFVPFKIQQFFFPVPTPGTTALLGGALLFGATMRRRSA